VVSACARCGARHRAPLKEPLTSRSRYRPDSAPDYGHRFHAGNVGDVWKHAALVEVLRRVAGRSVAYLDTHAGEGAYALAATGEWTEGIGRLWNAAPADGALSRYLELCRRLGRGAVRPEEYPGSPVLARAVLGDGARLVLWERDRAAHAALERRLAGDACVRTVCDDGLATLASAVFAAADLAETVVVLIDPPWTQKSDWTDVPDALAQAASASPRASFLLWYPVKSLTRPNAMTARLERAGVSATIAELVTTPLEQQRHRLNGSGVLLVRPPAGAVEAIAAAAPAIGARCATRAGTWSLRVRAWG
jgi:23S rRNA (adenine2030-N6)-methyltransferase